MAGDALTDIDFTALIEAHERTTGIATLAVKRVPNVDEYGVVIAGRDGRVQGFQEKPDPAEALSDLASCMIYVFSPEVFDYFPADARPDFALDVFPALLEHDVPFHVHAIDEYWNDVGSIGEYLQGNLDVVEGHVRVDPAGELLEGGPEEEIRRAARTAAGSSAAGCWWRRGRRSRPVPASTAPRSSVRAPRSGPTRS